MFYQNKDHNVRQSRFHVCIKMRWYKRRVCKRKAFFGQSNIRYHILQHNKCQQSFHDIFINCLNRFFHSQDKPGKHRRQEMKQLPTSKKKKTAGYYLTLKNITI